MLTHGGSREPRPSGSGQALRIPEKNTLLGLLNFIAAYLITFSCYGHHLPGQDGAVDRRHNVPGTRLAEPRPKLRRNREASLKQAPFEMDADQGAVTLKAIREVCDYKHWELLAAHVRTNHVHAVVDTDAPPEFVMNTFKSYASRALNLRAARLLRWARHFEAPAISYPVMRSPPPSATFSKNRENQWLATRPMEPPCVIMRTSNKKGGPGLPEPAFVPFTSQP